MIVMDTHTLVWLVEGSEKLGEKSRLFIDQALQEDELYVSAISFWEIGMLLEKGRIALRSSVSTWRTHLLDQGLKEHVINGNVAILSASLPEFHGDPADRLIVATAIETGSVLCTADEKILSWKHSFSRLNAKH